ncbi:primase C-terminal domain-containing protein [Sulfurimonas sp.]|uniref:primase C-terminal domain-containing protein n=1 Tax=Sulfurimonas sp. TaxID=2022749 RepID=UPI0025E9BDDA|nr:primase C-terminal domain-containing protein [Sulfurimonas sp.]
MTIDLTDDNDALLMLLLRSLPTKIKAGNEKHLSNIRTYPTVVALKTCKFINFNSKDKISMMIFDIDEFRDKTALEYFKNIRDFLEYIIEKIGCEPTYVLETQKGFHFAYHLKNHVFMHQPKAVAYLQNIKKAIGEILGCDPIASNRLNGVWRNPLLHTSYFSEQINYELADFKIFLPSHQKNRRNTSTKVKINETQLTEGNRNAYLFECAMRHAKGFSSLTTEEILIFLEEANKKSAKPLASQELSPIARSVYKYWSQGKIRFGDITKKNINEGVMEFEKMANLSFDEYQAETKQRQRLSALRTNELKNKNNIDEQLTQAREASRVKREATAKRKIQEAIAFFNQAGIKVTINAISKNTKLDRRTVKKYYENKPC